MLSMLQVMNPPLCQPNAEIGLHVNYTGFDDNPDIELYHSHDPGNFSLNLFSKFEFKTLANKLKIHFLSFIAKNESRLHKN